MDAPVRPASLLTFAPMIDSELARLALARYGVPYRETPHLFGWASVIGLFRSGSKDLPQLTGNGPATVTVRAIIDRFDKSCAADKRLLPAESDLARQVEADWVRFNTVLGGAVAVYCYYELLPHRAIMIEPFSRGIPRVEAAALEMFYPAFAGLIKSLLHLNSKTAADALAGIRCIFDEVDRRLAGGQEHLVGNRLTLSDLALATAAGPVVLPDGFGSPLPPLNVMPAELQTLIATLRQTATGRYVEQIYRRHRLGEI